MRLSSPGPPTTAEFADPWPPAAEHAPHAGDVAARRRERDLLRLGVAGAVTTFVVLATLWTLVPIYRPTDEASHVAYARELSHGRLPTIQTPMTADGDPLLARLLGRRDTVHSTIWTANHPPLYYAVAAVPLRLGSATGHPVAGVRLARLLSVGLAALSLIALAYVVVQLVPGRPQLAVTATGLVALLPPFIDVSSAVYNDALAVLTAMAALAASVVFVVRGPSAARLAAVTTGAGLAALTRTSGLLITGVAGLAVLIGVWRATEGGAARRIGRAVAWAAVVGVVVVAVAGWFYLRNLRLYGDFTGSAALFAQFDRSQRGTIGEFLTRPGFWQKQLRYLWGPRYARPVAGHGVTQHVWMFGLLPLAGLLLAGAGRLWSSTRRALPAVGGDPARLDPARLDPARRVAIGLCVLLLVLLELSVVQFVSQGGRTHIRYLFPGLAIIGLCAAAGLAALPGGRRGLPGIAILLELAAVNLWVRWHYFDELGPGLPPLLLAVVVPPLLVGLWLQAWSLWRLAPEPATPPRLADDLIVPAADNLAVPAAAEQAAPG